MSGVAIVGAAETSVPQQVAYSLGIEPRWIDTTNVGGCSFLAHVRHAAAAIHAGYASTVLITHGESGRSRVGTPPRPPDPASLSGQFEAPYGARAPFTRFTLVDHVMCYDAFAHLPLMGLESMGFLEPGAAGDFYAGGGASPGGTLPVNTNGGGLSYPHTGMYGMFAIQEAVRQLRGEAAAQVPGVEVSTVLGFGGMFAAAAVLVLARWGERPPGSLDRATAARVP